MVRTPPNGTAQPGDLPHAWLVAAKEGGALNEFDRLTLHQAVTIVALELLRRPVADDTKRRLASDLLTALVSGELTGPDLARRLEPFGLGDRVGVLVCSRPARSSPTSEEALTTAVRDEAPGGLAAGTASRSRARCSRTGAGRRTRRSSSPSGSARASHAEIGSELPAGAGRAAAAGDLRRAFHEARCALEAPALAGDESSNGSGPPLLATYRDLGRFQLLLSLQDDDALRLFCDSILVPHEGGRGRLSGGELMRSLESFIECNGQWDEGDGEPLLSPAHAALPDPPRRGADRAGRSTRRATASTSGSRCAGAS